jgi:N-acetylglucosaminyldiphosphoundecaprenol N-acetyl-beta-D-mannosaminyltransferase
MRIDVLGVPFDAVTPEQAVSIALELMDTERGGIVVTPNPEIVWICQRNPEAMQAITSADLVLADGIGVIRAAKTLRTPLPGRVTGFDWFCAMLQACEERGKRIFLLGGRPGVAEAVAGKYPAVYGTQHGYFTDDAPVLQAIKDTKPDFLAVCFGAPKQEIWMKRNREELSGILMAGLGGSLDVLAGTVMRAPKWIQKIGFEWLYRALRQPSRIKRLLMIPKFMRTVKKEARKRAKEG